MQKFGAGVSVDRHKRKNYFPDKPNQFRFAAVVVTYILAYTVVIFVGVYYYAFAELAGPKEEVVEQVAAMESFSFLTQHFPLPFLVAAGLVVLHSLYFSHRIFGPIIQLRHVREKVEEGDLSVRLQLRKRDLLREVESNMNEVLDSYEEEIGTIRRLQEESALIFGKLKEQFPALSEEEKKQLMAELDTKGKELQEFLSKFKFSA